MNQPKFQPRLGDVYLQPQFRYSSLACCMSSEFGATINSESLIDMATMELLVLDRQKVTATQTRKEFMLTITYTRWPSWH
jgi:hypothetical protein